MANTKAFKVKNGLELGAISDTISDTAVDVFVYDTSKDSDGGAWRKRTQGTSWYNETLNTATRGSRKEFPSVAVIVAESNQVTIYDGDDPSLPMWMVFNANGSTTGTFWYSTRNTDSVTAHNGFVAFGSNGDTWGGLRSSNFLADKLCRRSDTGLYGGVAVTERNVTAALPTISTTASYQLVNATVNDVAMTVLPNAPIDAATGLPVPTIAVATDGGVSVIKDDGTVVDIIMSSSTYSESHYTSLSEEGTVTVAFNNSAGLEYGWVYTLNIPSSDTSISVNGQSPALSWFDTRNPLSFSQDFWISNTNGTDGVKLSAMAANFPRLAFGTSTALTNTVDNLGTEPYLFNYISDTYNTGWMNGDIKLATLSDTDDTDVTGSELVTNGDFSSATGWSVPTGVSISGGVATFSSPSHGSNLQQTATSFVSGKTYTISVEVTAFTSGGITIYANYSSGTSTTVAVSKLRSVGLHSFTWTAASDGTGFSLQADSVSNGACILTLDNVSIREAEEDRSVNGNGLQVFGTVTKSAVATGADLVGYSGFSNVNYLEQPYNSDLDFGTGDFCYMGWFKTSSNGITMFERCASPRSGNGMTVYIDGTGKPLWYKIVSGTPTIVVVPTAAYNNNTWVHFAAIRQNGVVSLYFNGQKDGSASDSTDMTNTSAIFRLGVNATGTSGWTGSLALWRISATAPSPEQIAKIYEDEKFLFQENSQATLYGSSDAVTALAYDDSTELLHVGTSAGRSVFQGLRRVDNTTTAVSAAISASNNLVGEQ